MNKTTVEKRLVRPVTFAILGWLTALVLSACTGGITSTVEATLESAEVDAPLPTTTSPASDAPNTSPTSTTLPKLFPDDEVPPPGAEREFTTDFSIHSVSYDEILSGGPPKDGIPALDDPQFVSVDEAGNWLGDLEPVILFDNQGDTRIYPLQILMWHEIVNDVVGGMPVVITFCPLCNTAIAFDATLDGKVLDFGTSGRLRYSNLVMYDRQTESWWQQATGNAIIGELTGAQLTFLPASIISWSEARETFPDAQVLSRDTGFNRDYGRNPYTGYDNVNSSPFLYDGPATPGQLPPMARVTTVDLNDEAVAYPNDSLHELVVVNDTVGGIDIVVFWQAGLASALGASDISSGEDVGANGVFERAINGQILTFTFEGDTITDEQTGSTWNIFGEAVSGELSGKSMTSVVKVDHFWFSWAAFRPETRIYQP
jgi:hypothetical protein